MKTYVIIGGGGFLGAHLLHSFQENGVKNPIIIVDPNPKLETFTEIDLDLKRITYVKDSFMKTDVLDKVLVNCEAVFHLCAVGHTGKYGAMRHKDFVYKVNVYGTMELIRKCKQYKVKRFVYSSSVAVNFTGYPIYNVTEHDPLPEPSDYLDIYSITKAEAESFVLAESTREFKTSALRFRAIYGPQDVSVAEKVVRLVTSGITMARITPHGRESISNMSAGENCGTALYLADKALQKEDGPHGRAYFINDGETVGQYTVWGPLITEIGKTPPDFAIPYWIVSLFVTIVAFFCFEILNCGPPMTRFELEILAYDNTYSIQRARDELGYEPKKNLMSKTVKYYKQNPYTGWCWFGVVVGTIKATFYLCMSFIVFKMILS